MQKLFHSTRSNRGFSLGEIMVVVAIVSIIATVVIFDYGSFNDNLALSAAGQEMALAIRQAQTNGINVKESKTPGSFSSAYGIYFNPTTNPNDYYIFADSNSNLKYDVGNGCGGAVTECVEKVTIRNNIRITGISIVGSTCPVDNSATSLAISFFRPNPDALINFVNNSGTIVCGSSGNAQVVLTSPKGKVLTIYVERTGQVLAQ